MKMVPFDVSKLNNVGRMNNDIYSTLQEFSASGHKCVKLEGWTQKNAQGCVASLRQSIKRYRLFHIQATVRGNDVFLIRKEM